MKLKKGYIQVYTGNGKGKTTAAIGLAIRAAGAGLKVYIGQFIKKGPYSELKALKRHKKNIKIEQFGRGCFIKGVPKKRDCELAEHGLKAVNDVLSGGKFDVVILDEINIALHLKLLSQMDLIKLIAEKPKHIELVFTGRYVPKSIAMLADLITEMREIKHYFRRETRARQGIEK